MSDPTRRARLLVVLAIALLPPTVNPSAAEFRPPVLGLGHEYDLAARDAGTPVEDEAPAEEPGAGGEPEGGAAPEGAAAPDEGAAPVEGSATAETAGPETAAPPEAGIVEEGAPDATGEGEAAPPEPPAWRPLPAPIDDASVAPDHPLYVRIRAPWSMLEPAPGTYDWSELEKVVEAYRAARYEIALCVHGANPAVDPAGGLPAPGNETALKAWLDFARAAALQFKGRVRFYEVGEAPNRAPAWSAGGTADYAYVLKNTSVTVRSADPGAIVMQGSLALAEATLAADLAWQRDLYAQEVATYVDVLPIRPDPGVPLAAAVGRVYDLLLEHDPSAQLWAVAVPLGGGTARERAADLLARFIAGQGEGAAVVSLALGAGPDGGPEFRGVLLDLHKLFLPTYQRVTSARLKFEAAGPGAPAPAGVIAYEFFDAGAFQGLVGYHAPDPPPDGRASLVLATAAVRGLAVYDIVGGAAGPARGAEPDFRSNTTRVPVAVLRRPLVVQYARVPIKGFEAEKEALEIRGTGLITAEEVIAAHQAFMADQRFRLRHYRADAVLTYHGKIAGSNTVDISFDNAFFWDPGTGAEWQQRALYYNGVLWRGKKLPELPIPQPEKVFTLPLDINLNKDYTYRYAGREKVGEYECHVLDFKPIDPTKNLYDGRAWIETRTFAPVKTSTVQTRLQAPLISSEEQDYYAPVAGPDGSTYWLLSRVEGQQILTVAGQNLVLLREVDFKGFRINDQEFAAARREAYASVQPMLRDTERGLRYLERTDGGDRIVKETTAKSALLGLAGLYRQSGLDYPVVPLVGAGYFNFNVRDRDIQMTALLGGVVNLFSITHPKLVGERVDGSLQAVTLLVDVTDQLYIRGDERETSNVDIRSQSLSAGLGVPLGNFVRFKATYDLSYDNYSRDEDTDTFVVPTDTAVHTPGIEWEFNRAAWTVSASAQRGFRGRWEAWGDTTPATPATLADFPGAACDSPGSCFDDFDPDRDDYDRYEFAVSKQFFLPLFQKLRFEALWQTGSRLDRFSEFNFSFFGNRVRGFAGSGIRYDRGGIARAQYAFNIANVVRFDATLDHAYVRDGLTADDYRRFTGVGLAGNLMGPWETVLQFDIGVALQSDFDDLRGNTEFQIGLLKYF
jgi:hypothetical protein